MQLDQAWRQWIEWKGLRPLIERSPRARPTSGRSMRASRRWSDTTGPGQDALNGGVGTIEQLSDLVKSPALLPSLPHHGLLGIRVVDASPLLHAQHPCCLCSDQCVASTG